MDIECRREEHVRAVLEHLVAHRRADALYEVDVPRRGQQCRHRERRAVERGGRAWARRIDAQTRRTVGERITARNAKTGNRGLSYPPHQGHPCSCCRSSSLAAVRQPEGGPAGAPPGAPPGPPPGPPPGAGAGPMFIAGADHQGGFLFLRHRAAMTSLTEFFPSCGSAGAAAAQPAEASNRSAGTMTRGLPNMRFLRVRPPGRGQRSNRRAVARPQKRPRYEKRGGASRQLGSIRDVCVKDYTRVAILPPPAAP